MYAKSLLSTFRLISQEMSSELQLQNLCWFVDKLLVRKESSRFLLTALFS